MKVRIKDRGATSQSVEDGSTSRVRAGEARGRKEKSRRGEDGVPLNDSISFTVGQTD